MTLTQGHGCGIDKHKFIVCRIKWERLNQSLQNLVSISPWSCLSPDEISEEFGRKLFFFKLSDVFSKIKHSFGHISEMVGPIDVKRKGGALVGYWVNYVTLTFDLTPGLDLWFSKVKCQNSCFSGIVIWLMWNKKKANQLDNGLTVWSCPLTTPMTLNLQFQCQRLK